MEKRKHLLLLMLFFLLYTGAAAQSVYMPYNAESDLRLNKMYYSRNSTAHTALKPYLTYDSLLESVPSLLYPELKAAGPGSWFKRKLFSEHLIEVSDSAYSFYGDFLPDLHIGRDFSSGKMTWQNTRGFQVGGTVGKKFSFYSSGYENQARFTGYYNEYIDSTTIVPGQSFNRGSLKTPVPATRDWSYVTAVLSYTPVKYLNVAVGHDKHFIGNGYRSLLLSDFSSPYTFIKLTGNLGNVQYMAMWTAMQDPGAKKLSYYAGNRKKGGVFHYLDWTISRRLSVGFFDAIIWSERDDEGNKRGFNPDYLNPVIFLRPLEANAGSPDNALLGFNAAFKLTDNACFYGQFLLDEFEARHFFSAKGSYRNKYGYQMGLRGNGAGFSYLLEYNAVKPYTYSAQVLSVINYANYNEPLAHPLGANFREALARITCTRGRLNLTAQLNYARYGYNTEDGVNYGKDIFRLFNEGYREYGNYIGQGLTTDRFFAEAQLSFLVNPKNNLRLVLDGCFRKETNNVFTKEASLVNLGIQSSFRNFYRDF